MTLLQEVLTTSSSNQFEYPT